MDDYHSTTVCAMAGLEHGAVRVLQTEPAPTGKFLLEDG